MAENILRDTFIDFNSGHDLTAESAEPLLDAMIAETNIDALIAVLSAWDLKGIAEDEIFYLVSILRSRMTRIKSTHETFIDAVGTGGSAAKPFNVSTAAAFVIAGSGMPVAKHGNRAASSSTGSADVLSELGVQINADPSVAQKNLNELGICYMFAPRFHTLSPTLAQARRAFGKPSIFNCLGPLCNPASAPHQLIGAWNSYIARIMANTLARLGTKLSWVVNGSENLDEISLHDKTNVFEVTDDSVENFEITLGDFGIFETADSITPVRSPAESASVLRGILQNNARDESSETLVAINAAAAIHLSGAAPSLREGFEMAVASIRYGDAMKKLSLLTDASRK